MSVHDGTSESPATLESSTVTEHSLLIDDVNIGYCRYGKGPNRILCICGAVGCYAKDWPESVLRLFEPELFTIICIDPPGYGKSRPPDRKQEVLRCQKDSVFCLKLMESLQLTPFTVMGWSEGSRTAVHVAGKGEAAKVNRMILLAACTRMSLVATNAVRGIRSVDQWLPEAKEPYLKHYSEDFLKKQWADVCDVYFEVYEVLGGRFPCDQWLGKIKVPTLVLAGGRDRHCGKNNFQNVIKNLKTETHLLGGHSFHVEYPNWFADKVLQFIKSTGG